MDPKKKFWFFKQSKHFCSVPWNQFSVLPNGDITTCSHGRTMGNILGDNIESILTSPTIQKIKSDLIQDQFNDNCTVCHNRTVPGEHFNLRDYYNSIYKSTNVNYDDLEAFNLSGIDLHWDNTCNFKCVYCNPLQSSMIAHEQGVSFDSVDNENTEKIIDTIVQNQHQIKEIYLSGGEPLLIKKNFKLLSKLTNTDIPLRINSNISYVTDSNLVFAEIKRFKNVLWTISADSMTDRFDYIRSGGNWVEFLKNLNTLSQLGHGLRVNLVWFIGSISTFAATIEFFARQYNITNFTVNQLVEHEYLQSCNAPWQVKQKAKTDLSQLLNSGLIQSHSNSWYNIVQCIKELDLPVKDPTGYCEYFDKLDQLRGTNWRQTFPELA